MNNADTKTIINPLTVIVMIWGVVVVLFELEFSELLDGIHEEFAWFLIKDLCFLLGGYFLVSLLSEKERKKSSPSSFDEKKLWKLNKNLIKIWIPLNIVQVIYSGGVPLLWYILGLDKGYFDFGIHGINGFSNAAFYIICLNMYILFHHSKDPKYKKCFLAMCCWPVLLVTRQVIIVLLIEMFFLYVYFHKINKKTIFKSIFLMAVLIYLFGVAGDFRSGGDAFKELAQPKYDWLYEVPSGILWVYIYMTTPIANIQNIFETITPAESFNHTASLLLPTPIRALIYADGVGDDNALNGLITEAFNVSTFLNEFYLDYGAIYVYVVMFIVGGLSRSIYGKVKYRQKYSDILNYCVFSQILFLSIFYNHFLYLPVVFQFVVIWYFKIKLERCKFDKV